MLPTIGIIPAAGEAERMSGLPKFLLPTPQGSLLGDLWQKMARGGAEEVFAFTRCEFMSLAHQALHPWSITYYPARTKTMSETVLLASLLENVKGANVLFGMPDTYFEADYRELISEMNRVGHIAAVGCFRQRPDQIGKLGGVMLTENDFVTQVIDKSSLDWVWGIMVWSPDFWEYIKPEHPHVGYAIQAAIDDGRDIPAVRFDGDYYDCGTKMEYYKLCAKWHKEAEAVTA